MSSFGKRLREARKACKLSQAAIAKTLSVSTQSVSEWERGLYQPSAERLAKLAKLLRVSVDWLLSGGDGAPIGVGEGRLVPKITTKELATFEPLLGASSSHDRVLSHFACGPHSFQISIDDTANAPRFQPGDSVIIDPDLKPTPGDMVLAVIRGTALFRKYRQRGKDVDLEPLNPDWETVTASTKLAVIRGTMSEHSQPRRV